jgi:hypothetical protein
MNAPCLNKSMKNYTQILIKHWWNEILKDVISVKFILKAENVDNVRHEKKRIANHNASNYAHLWACS